MVKKKSIAIIYSNDDNAKKAATILMHLIEDKTEYQSSILDEKQFKSHTKFSSSMPAILIGKLETSKFLSDSIEWEFDKLGMHYGWIGKKAIIMVEDYGLTLEEFEQLVENDSALKKAIVEDSQNEGTGILTSILYGLIYGAFLPLSLAVTGYLVYSDWKEKGEIKKLQYQHITTKFLKDGLLEFIKHIEE